MTGHAKVSGSWQQLTNVYGKVSGTWQTIQHGYVKVSGSWQEFFTNFSEAPTLVTSEGTGSVTIPTNASRVRITSVGVGGPGGTGGTGAQGGGGAGEYVVEYLLNSSDWGNSISYQVGGFVFYSDTSFSGTLNLYGSTAGGPSNGTSGDDQDGTDNGHGVGGGGGTNVSPYAETIHTGATGSYTNPYAGGASTGTYSTYGHGGTGNTNAGQTGGMILFEWFGP